MGSIEQEVERAIMAQKRWADLDNRMRDLIGSTQEYDKKILRFSIENQLRYRGNLVRFVINNEHEYYRELLKYSRDHLMLFPYHLSDFIINGMRITPFQYYLSTMAQIIEQEKSYDTLPNFTAADCLRLLGIGRNQYIDIMNELRATYRRIPILSIGMKRSARSLLPNKPDKDVPIEPWWLVNAGYITEDDVRSMVTTAERSIIDRLFTHDGLSNQIVACDLNEAHVRSLYLKGLIYLDVPIYDDDYIVVPPLEGFVMNRVTGDYFETLLYKIFISIDQNITVQELAKILEIDIKLVKNAVSMYCRLKFAYKKNIYIDITKCHPSWHSHLQKYQDMGINVSKQHAPVQTSSSWHLTQFINELASIDVEQDQGTEVMDLDPSSLRPNITKDALLAHSPSLFLSPNQPSTNKKIALFYDSNLVSFLMMGNLSAKLQNHAVMMFERGKLPDELIDSFLEEISKIQTSAIDDDGYEARRYYIHALMLQRTIEFIRTDLKLASNLFSSTREVSAQDTISDKHVGLDLLQVESYFSRLDTKSCERLLKKNYQLIISVAPLNHDVKLDAATSLPHLGPGWPLINSLWFRLYIYCITGHGPTSMLLVQGFRLTKLPEAFCKHNTLIINYWNRDPTFVSLNSALNVINEALTNSPILVQAYPIQPIGGNLINSEEKVFVPLPLGSDSSDYSLEASHEHKPEFENDPAVLALSKHINLHKLCGYLTLLRSARSVRKLMNQEESPHSFMTRRKSPTPTNEQRYEKENSSIDGDRKLNITEDSFQTNDEDEELTLFDCQFGIPLFDRFLNKHVRSKISSQSLCDPQSLDELVSINRDLNDKIQHFVEMHQKNREIADIDGFNCGDQRHFFRFPQTEQFKCSIPRPAQNLIFADGNLTILSDID